MPSADERTDAGTPALSGVLRLGLIGAALAFAGLGGWIVFGAVTASEPNAFVVAPPADVAPAVSAAAQQVVPSAASDAAGGTASTDTSGDSGVSGDAGLAAGSAAGNTAGNTAGNAARVDPGWAARTAAATEIPLRALQGYAGAELAMTERMPGCGIRWSTLAALGSIESAHGTHAGSAIGEDGITRPGIFGIDLTGDASARITDTDGGVWDGKADIDRAVGPMQFIPATWETWGADGNGDGVRDPQQIDDAALAAAGYLCDSGDLSSPENWRTAIFAYNHLDSYVNSVARTATEYAGRAG